MHTVNNIGVDNRDGILRGQVYGRSQQIADSYLVQQTNWHVLVVASLKGWRSVGYRILAKDCVHVSIDAFKFEIKKVGQVFIQRRKVNYLAALYCFPYR